MLFHKSMSHQKASALLLHFFMYLTKRQKMSFHDRKQFALSNNTLQTISEITWPYLASIILYSKETLSELSCCICSIDSTKIAPVIDTILSFSSQVNSNRHTALCYLQTVICSLIHSVIEQKYKYIQEILYFCVNSITSNNIENTSKALQIIINIYCYIPKYDSEYMKTLTNDLSNDKYFCILCENNDIIIGRMMDSILIMLENIEKPSLKEPRNWLSKLLFQLSHVIHIRLSPKLRELCISKLEILTDTSFINACKELIGFLDGFICHSSSLPTMIFKFLLSELITTDYSLKIQKTLNHFHSKEKLAYYVSLLYALLKHKKVAINNIEAIEQIFTVFVEAKEWVEYKEIVAPIRRLIMTLVSDEGLQDRDEPKKESLTDITYQNLILCEQRHLALAQRIIPVSYTHLTLPTKRIV